MPRLIATDHNAVQVNLGKLRVRGGTGIGIGIGIGMEVWIRKELEME